MISQPTIPLLVGYASRGKVPVLVAPSAKQLAVYSSRVFNRSGSAMDAGIVRKFAQSANAFKFLTYDGSVYTDATASLLAGTTITGINDTNGHGFAFASKTRSGLLGFNVVAAAASGVYVYEYWNGSTWATLTTVSVPPFTATGNVFIAFLPPADWAKGGAATLPSDMYCIRLRTTTVVANDVTINAIWAGQMIEFVEGLADNAGLAIEFDPEKPFILEAEEGLMPYFGTANADNGMQVAYSTI